jgi:type IV pilus assembly protein PilV
MSKSMTKRAQSGITLLETLIAILVLSFGMLGMLGVIINSLKLTSSSNYRTIAAQQAYSMADVLRGTPALIASYAAPTAAPTSNCLTTVGCDEPHLIGMQFELWLKSLATSLPSGNGTICRDSTPNDGGNPTNWKCDGAGGYVVKVCWDETRVSVTGGQYCTWTNI